MSGELVALLLTFGVHVLGAGVLVSMILRNSDVDWRSWWPRDDDDGGSAPADPPPPPPPRARRRGAGRACRCPTRRPPGRACAAVAGSPTRTRGPSAARRTCR